MDLSRSQLIMLSKSHIANEHLVKRRTKNDPDEMLRGSHILHFHLQDVGGVPEYDRALESERRKLWSPSKSDARRIVNLATRVSHANRFFRIISKPMSEVEEIIKLHRNLKQMGFPKYDTSDLQVALLHMSITRAVDQMLSPLVRRKLLIAIRPDWLKHKLGNQIDISYRIPPEARDAIRIFLDKRKALLEGK